MYQAITDYKGETCHVADINVLHPDKLNTFFVCLEDNTVPPTWSAYQGLWALLLHVRCE